MRFDKVYQVIKLYVLKPFPKDLMILIISTLLCVIFVVTPLLNETPIRIMLGLLLVYFLPGYSLIAVLFPRKDELNGVERIALSIGSSIAIVPLLGMALTYTPFGIRLLSTLSGLSIFTVSFAIIAYIRRCDPIDSLVSDVDK